MCRRAPRHGDWEKEGPNIEAILGMISSEPDAECTRLRAIRLLPGLQGEADSACGPGWAMGVERSDAGLSQRMGLTWNEDRSVFGLFVGELFGTDALIAGLQRTGHRSDDAGQCGLMMNLWEKYGPGLIDKANGLFAAAVWETEARRLTLLLDWVGGIHHMYYAPLDGGIAFASQIRSLLAVDGLRVEVNERALYQYLDFGHILPPETLFKGIYQLPPGCALTYEDGSIQVRRIFKLRFQPGASDNWLEQFQEIFQQAIAQRLQGGEEVGAFLSGGLDSSFNVATMSALMRNPVKTFSISFPQPGFDESEYARLVANHYHTDHHELTLDSADVLDDLPQMIWALEEPAMDYSYIPTFHLARFAKQHVDVVISGDGPDHLLGRHYPVAFARAFLGKIPGLALGARLVLDGTPDSVRGRLWRWLRRHERGRFLWKALQSVSTDALQAYLSIYHEIAYRNLLPASATALLSEDLRDSLADDLQVADPDNIEGDESEFNRILALDLAIDGAFGVFAKVGKMAAHHSLIVREPYLDLDLCRYLGRLPSRFKVRGSTLDFLTGRARRKYILYEAARDAVPAEVLKKPKQGFQAPIATWLRDWIGNRDSKYLLPALTRDVELLDEGFVNRVLREHQSGLCDHGSLIMMLVTLDLWYGIFVSNEVQRPNWTWRDWLSQ